MKEDKRPILLEDLGMMYATESSKQKVRYGLYKCGYCGKEFKGSTYAINAGAHKGCGCLNGEKHGMRKHRFYHTWRQMVSRCSNPKNPSYKHYGGRGIYVCEEWKEVKTFIEWVEATHPNIEGYTLDRIDNDGNYEPTNCRWAVGSLQAVNKRKQTNNKSGYVGISWSEKRQKWRVQIGIARKSIGLGRFKTLEEAIQVRNDYIIENNLPHKLNKDYIKKEENDKEEYRGI